VHHGVRLTDPSHPAGKAATMTRAHWRGRLAVVTAGVCSIASVGLSGPSPAAAKTTTQTYVVVFQSGAATTNASTLVKNAGGKLAANWAPISVVLARSASSTFVSKIKNNPNVIGVSATSSLGTQVVNDTGAPEDTSSPAPASGGEPLASLQWDMNQINAFAAHAINAGSSSVVVADVDTGLDFTHPDLAPHYSADLSSDCTSGVPAPLNPGNDTHGHGTHTAGTIGAAVNGVGISGVAPNVTLAGLRAGNSDGYFFPEAVICSYMWIATHNIAVANNSYYVDPWQFNCRDDADQRAIWNAVRRAISFAQSKGTVVVASEGNISADLSHPTVDESSPDFPPGSAIEREITNSCGVVPVEIPGVVGVTATGSQRLKSYYSSYGISTADVTAPGGDRRFQQVADAGGGRLLSTWPAIVGCALSITDQGARYCWLQGTSMAAPHAAGVAALLASRGLRGEQLIAALSGSATPLECPDTEYLTAFPQPNGEPQECTGSAGHNSFYGAGEVDALRAVS